MTENEYMKAKSLGHITSAINGLQEVSSYRDFLPDIIKPEEYKHVLPTLCKWQERLFKSIEINE
jgi:hypothetical protein